MMENLIKGWVLSALGFVVLILTLLHWMGYIALPNSSALDSNTDCLIALVVSGALFSFPKTKIDDLVSNAIQVFIDKFKSK
jgi:hypothetical protein